MTLFISVLDASADDKAAALHRAVLAYAGRSERDGAQLALFERRVESFSSVPGTPFCYWVTDAVLECFCRPTRMAFLAKLGLKTDDDFRFIRLWFEPPTHTVSYRPLAKGGSFSPVYGDVHLLLQWNDDGWELKSLSTERWGNPGKRIFNEAFYFRPGLTWSRRSQVGLSIRTLPKGCIFGDKGPAAFIEGDAFDDLLSLLAIATSSPFRYLVALQMAFGSYEVGVIQRTPVPQLTSTDIGTLAKLTRRDWSLRRALDTSNETSHAFLLPALVNWIDRNAIEEELGAIRNQIDDLAFKLYGIDAKNFAAIKVPTPSGRENGDVEESDNDDDDSCSGEEVALGSDQFSSWLVGVSFGRFDARLAVRERPIPPEPEPFDPLPARSPGMYPEDNEPTDRLDILVDDEGHADDLAARTLAVAERVKVDAPENLRGWLAKEFFSMHIRMYSKSRRKAPIYWQLATPSASYSVWLYIHAFSKDTLFRVQNDYVAPKLAHEERRLESLTGELRDGATAAQRKQLAAQKALVEELRAFLDEVKRVAPLWNPHLDDGVILNFAPLWRLVPQNKSWQKELKTTWDALCEGKYDWARLAMHLWPERVVPKCAKDRSLAIAHGLEDVFWVEGTDGKWTARKTPTETVVELVKQRTSTAAKSALKSLLEAPTASGTAAKPKKAPRKGNAHA